MVAEGRGEGERGRGGEGRGKEKGEVEEGKEERGEWRGKRMLVGIIWEGAKGERGGRGAGGGIWKGHAPAAPCGEGWGRGVCFEVCYGRPADE